VISRRRFSTTLGGSFFAVGRGGPSAGRGSNLLIIDDPLKNSAEARSELVRDSIHQWYLADVRTRVHAGGAIILISTRWHEDDLPGRILREGQGERWDVLSLPAIAEVDEPFRREGDALWPGIYSLSELEKIRIDIGADNFMSLYQGRPSAAEGTTFKRVWWRSYREPPKCKQIVQGWDTAFKTGRANDYSACTTWGTAETGYYLLHLWRDRVDFPTLKKRMRLLAEQWNPNVILVEDAASGQSLIQEMKHMSALPIIPVKIDKDKESRAKAITPIVEAGRVFLPESCPLINDYKDEFAGFPKAPHDDMVDSTTLVLNYLRHQQINTVAYYTIRL
jgi:predicted phage terminase large subunit-like protein